MLINRRSLLKSSGCFSVATLAMNWGLQALSFPVAANVIMQLDWVFNAQFAGLLLADYLGLYQQKGLNVIFKPLESGMLVLDVVAANSMMIGCAEQNMILAAQAKGLPIKAIATMFQASPYALMALPESGIQSLQDLVGKRVGVHEDGVKIMELVKGVNGLKPADIEIVEIPSKNKLNRLIKGEFDALQCYAVDEPIEFEQQMGQAPILLPMDQYGYKAYSQVFFTTDRLLQQHPKQVKAFLEASFEGWRRAIADIPTTAKLVAETYATPGSKYADVTYQQKSLKLVSEYIMRGITPTEIGKISPAQWQRTVDLMAQYGIIETAPNSQESLELGLWVAKG